MQCVNCKLENMPGTQSCVRCGTAMDLGGAVLTVEPPRARPWQKRARRLLPWRPTMYSVRDSAAAATAGVREKAARELRLSLPPFSALLRTVLPGWAHRYLGHTQRAKYFIGAYAALGALGLLTFGSPFGWFCLGMAVAVHAATVIDLLFNEYPTRFGAMLAMGLGLLVVLIVYLPVSQLVSSVVVSSRVLIPAPPLAYGDVLLVSPRAYRHADPLPGDVVLYRIPAAVVGGLQRGRARNVRILGDRFDRVVAGPNSEVLWKDKQLLVNGKPSEWSPLNVDRLPAELKIKTGPTSCVILPTTDPFLGPSAGRGTWETASNVPLRSVAGRVVVRNYPLYRWWWMQ